MQHLISKTFTFLKKEVVLTCAWILAIISAFFVTPDKKYISYIDFSSLLILWSLMIIMQFFSSQGFFVLIGKKLLNLTKKIWQLALVLILLCFFTSMLITNDVALITFVPFSILMLESCGRKDLLIPVIVLQTIAANTGSMFTPVGNPQNLYLFSLMNGSLKDFLLLMLPYTAFSLFLLLISILFIKNKNQPCTSLSEKSSFIKINKITQSIYSLLFITAIFTVLKIIPFYIPALLVLAFTLFIKPSLLLKADYALLFTFTGFFIFTGNIARIPVFKDSLQKLVASNEIITGITVSQVISNVPAALLLSGFAEDLKALTLGVNLGGLGTLIASMASLISFKLYAKTDDCKKGKFFLWFTIANLIFLALLVMMNFLNKI